MPVDPTTGAPFPGNIIPTADFRASHRLKLRPEYWPAANCMGCALGNFQLNTTLPNTVNQQTYQT